MERWEDEREGFVLSSSVCVCTCEFYKQVSFRIT